ncbi:M16 family metallopeptidase [Rhodoplanes roseus]|uniref:M16 family metallopeptidase n=1 Tax=Rhodoplanes roseus TaxID=29409 RepID=UPI001AEC9F53|nr:pitrilysin family protein [Rhodoplanes roseus]
MTFLVRTIAAAAVAALTVVLAPVAQATTIERVITPKGIEAWLVREPSVPLVAMEFAFRGGTAQDPADRSGLANMTASLLDEGAGDLDSRAFQQRLESKAIEFSVSAYRDALMGSLRTLTENRDEAFGLLKLALTAPRFDSEAVERIRADILAALRRDAMSPSELAGRKWWETAFPGHPYSRVNRGTLESVAAIQPADLKGYVGRVLARDNLKVGIVGNIDAATAARLVDDVFGSLPEKAQLTPVPQAAPADLGQRVQVDVDVPQSTLMLGGVGIARKDPDFVPAYVVNHILGGGSFSSRLYREVRENRGLAYGVSSSLVPLKSASLFFVSTATRADRVKDSMDVIEAEIRRMAESGPTAEELDQAKSYLKGSYALSFDTSIKIANQLVLIQLDDLGIDYIDRRNGLIEAVTLDDAKRVAKRLLSGKMLATVAGRPEAATAAAPAAAVPAPAVRAQ